MDIIIFSAIVVGLVQLFKTTFNITSRYIPVVTLVVTALIFVTYMKIEHIALNWEAIQNAIIIVLSATGLWSGGKAVIGK